MPSFAFASHCQQFCCLHRAVLLGSEWCFLLTRHYCPWSEIVPFSPSLFWSTDLAQLFSVGLVGCLTHKNVLHSCVNSSSRCPPPTPRRPLPTFPGSVAVLPLSRPGPSCLESQPRSQHLFGAFTFSNIFLFHLCSKRPPYSQRSIFVLLCSPSVR